MTHNKFKMPKTSYVNIIWYHILISQMSIFIQNLRLYKASILNFFYRITWPHKVEWGCKLSTTVADVICLSKRVDVTVLFFSVLRDVGLNPSQVTSVWYRSLSSLSSYWDPNHLLSKPSYMHCCFFYTRLFYHSFFQFLILLCWLFLSPTGFFFFSDAAHTFTGFSFPSLLLFSLLCTYFPFSWCFRGVLYNSS